MKLRGYFGEAAETGTRAACAPQIPGIRVIRVIRGSPNPDVSGGEALTAANPLTPSAGYEL